MSQITDHRRAIANALQSIGADPYVRDLILDHHDCAVKASREDGYNTCADHMLAAANSLKVQGVA